MPSLLLTPALSLLFLGCKPGAPFQDMLDLGLDQYLGTVTPSTVETDGDTTQYTFDVADGPICLRGGDFQMATRSGGSNDLLIYLQGGGACWSDFCVASEEAGAGVPDAGILNPDLEDNPVADWNVGYVPYCDGSLFSGDTTADDDGDGEIDRHHRGRLNLSAALDAIHQEHPSPRRILVSGISAGAYGTILSGMLARSLWPDTRIDVIADGGIGLGKPGDPGFITSVLEEWGITDLIPESCEDCFGDGHATTIASWGLERDANLRYLHVTSKEDFIISSVFLGVGAMTYSDEVLSETSQLLEAHPDQYARFVFEGARHTTLAIDEATDLGDAGTLPFETGGDNQTLDDILGRFDVIAIDGVTVADWLGKWLDDDPTFSSLVD